MKTTRLNHPAAGIRRTLIAICGLALLPARASYLMLDFGDAGAYTGTNSPAHAAGAIPTSYTTWHQVNEESQDGFHRGTGYDGYDGVAADSGGFDVEYDLGRNENDSDLDVHYGEGFVGAWDYRDGGAAGFGIWDTDLTRDAGVDNIGNRRDPLGIRLALAPGEYDVYVTAHFRGNTGVPLDLWSGGLTTSDQEVDANATGMTRVATGFQPDVDEFTWTEGSDYIKFTITLHTGEYLYVVSNNTDNSDDALANDGSLSSMQIVAIPEPGTMLVLTIAGTALLLYHRRRRR